MNDYEARVITRKDSQYLEYGNIYIPLWQVRMAMKLYEIESRIDTLNSEKETVKENAHLFKGNYCP